MRTHLVTLVATLGFTTFAVASVAAAAPAAGGAGVSAGAASSGGSYSGGSGGGGSYGGGGGGGRAHGGGGYSGGGGAHGGGGYSGGGRGGGGHWSGGGYRGGSHAGGGHWSGGGHSGSGHWNTGSAGHAGSSQAGGNGAATNEGHVDYARGSYIARGVNGARGGYGIVGYQSAGLAHGADHGAAAPRQEHSVRTALALGPRTGSAATAMRATDQFHPRTGPHTRPHGPHHYRAINYPYPTANFCESGPCQYQARGLWPSTVCNPLADENSYDRIGCPEAIKVKVPTLH